MLAMFYTDGRGARTLITRLRVVATDACTARERNQTATSADGFA